jgi:hydrogenase-1 operon protein HyaE
MTAKVLDRLTDELGYPSLDGESAAAWGVAGKVSVLFVPGEPERVPEAVDVAVALPELVKVFAGRLAPGVVAAGTEAGLLARCGVAVMPALLFFREGQLLGAIERMRNWDEYLTSITGLLDGTAPRRPAVAVVAAGPGGGCDAASAGGPCS